MDNGELPNPFRDHEPKFLSKEELIAIFEARPPRDPESLLGKGIWPEEDDIDEFIRELYERRQTGLA